MCGLFGWNLTDAVTTSERVALASVLALAMDDRGSESWGAWTSDQSFVHKMTGSILADGYAMRLAAFNSLAVHTRYATHGEVKQENAHPFRALNVVGAHNGCIWNAHDVMDRLYPERDYEVDSMHLIAHIAQGYDTKEMTGYGAVVWSDAADPDGFYCARFNGGELTVAVVFRKEDGIGDRNVGLVWASTREAVVQACKMAGLGFAVLRVKERTVYRLGVGRMERTTMRIHVRERPPIASIAPTKSAGLVGHSAEAFAEKENAANDAALAWLRADAEVRALDGGECMPDPMRRHQLGFVSRGFGALSDGFKTLNAAEESYCEGCDRPLHFADELREGICRRCDEWTDGNGAMPGKRYAG